MKFTVQAFLLATIAAVATTSLAISVDVEVPVIRGWNERELLEGRASIPNPTPTVTTPNPTPTASTVIAVPRPTGTKGNDAKCTSSAQCQTGNCNNGKCDDVDPLGAKCNKAANCASLNCVSAKCVPRPGRGKQGEVCNANNQCNNSSYCNRGKCDTTKRSGSVCYINDGCTSDICLNKKCILPASQAVNAACTADGHCVNGAFCNTNKCATKKNRNAVCYKGAGCKSGVCRNKKCA